MENRSFRFGGWIGWAASGGRSVRRAVARGSLMETAWESSDLGTASGFSRVVCGRLRFLCVTSSVVLVKIFLTASVSFTIGSRVSL